MFRSVKSQIILATSAIIIAILGATAYLVIDQKTLPDCLEVTAWTQDEQGNIDEIMGVRHKTLQVEGVQFHPESILTEHGHALLANFLKQKK